jgi:FAD/FMN-containing dehydrogenase
MSQAVAELHAAAEATLRARVRGAVLTSGDCGYDDARRIFNGAIERRPVAIAQVVSPQDVTEALAAAQRHDLSISVRAGGHGVAGHALGGDIVVDVSAMRGVVVDRERQTAMVRAGSTWGEVDAATQAHGLAVPGGRITHTGVAGLTLGGGEGWLSHKHGLTSDNLLAAELVTADGRHVHVSDESEPELFWALRGGGGNFGVVTSFTFRLHPLQPLVLGGMLVYRLSDAHDVLGVLADLHGLGRDEFAAAAVFLPAPLAPFIPSDLVGRAVLAVIPAWLADPVEGERFIAPLRTAVRPLVDATGPMPYTALQSSIDESAPIALRQRWTASLVPTLTPALVSDLAAGAASFPGPWAHIIVSPVGGAVTRAPADATAYPHREPSWLVHPVAQWPDPAHDVAQAAWVGELGARVRSNGETSTYLNVDDGDADRVRWAFGEARYRRLQAVKSAWDPDDVFHHCNHIPPAKETQS